MDDISELTQVLENTTLASLETQLEPQLEGQLYFNNVNWQDYLQLSPSGGTAIDSNGFNVIDTEQSMQLPDCLLTFRKVILKISLTIAFRNAERYKSRIL